MTKKARRSAALTFEETSSPMQEVDYARERVNLFIEHEYHRC